MSIAQIISLILILLSVAVIALVGVAWTRPNLRKDFPLAEDAIRGNNRYIILGVAGGVLLLSVVMLVVSSRRSPYRFQDEYVNYGAIDQCKLHPHMPQCQY